MWASLFLLSLFLLKKCIIFWKAWAACASYVVPICSIRNTQTNSTFRQRLLSDVRVTRTRYNEAKSTWETESEISLGTRLVCWSFGSYLSENKMAGFCQLPKFIYGFRVYSYLRFKKGLSFWGLSFRGLFSQLSRQTNRKVRVAWVGVIFSLQENNNPQNGSWFWDFC